MRRATLSLCAMAVAAIAAFGVTPAAMAQLKSVGADKPVKIRFAYVPVVGAAPLFVLASAGWAKEAGLEISPVRFESGPPAISALASGTIDAMAIGIAPIAVAKAKGLDVRVVAAVATGGSGFVANSVLAETFDAEGGDVAKTFATFHKAHGRPAKLATLPAGGVPTVALNHWLFKLNKVDREDVQIIPMGIDAVQLAMLTGNADGGTMLEPTLTVALRREPKLRMIVTASQMFDEIPGVVIAVTGDLLRQQPNAVEKLISLMIRANELIRQRPLDAAGYSSAVLGGGLIDQATLARALVSKAVSFVSDPRAIEEPTKRMLAYQVELGDFAIAPTIDGLFDTGPYLRAMGRRPAGN